MLWQDAGELCQRVTVACRWLQHCCTCQRNVSLHLPAGLLRARGNRTNASAQCIGTPQRRWLFLRVPPRFIAYMVCCHASATAGVLVDHRNAGCSRCIIRCLAEGINKEHTLPSVALFFIAGRCDCLAGPRRRSSCSRVAVIDLARHRRICAAAAVVAVAAAQLTAVLQHSS